MPRRVIEIEIEVLGCWGSEGCGKEVSVGGGFVVLVMLWGRLRFKDGIIFVFFFMVDVLPVGGWMDGSFWRCAIFVN